MPLIHVIIPVYNARRYLNATVRSVLEQPCNELDIVLVDDGSTDRSGELCDELAASDNRIHVIHQNNAGVSAARNTGIRYVLDQETRNDAFIAFLDSDDLWVPGVISSSLCSQIQQQPDSDVFVFGSYNSNEDISRFSHPRRYEDLRQEGGSNCIWKLQGTFCANLYRIDLLRKWGIRFQEGLKYSEDKIFMLQCGFLARYVHFVPQLLHIYRENTASAMKQFFRIDPIDYYTPIIDAWIASDLFLNSFSEQTGCRTISGATLASIYFLDMSTLHFERWHRPGRLRAACRDHPHYDLFLNMDPKCVSAKQYADRTLLVEHPLRFRFRCYAKGAIVLLARLILTFKPIQRLHIRRKYPLDHI